MQPQPPRGGRTLAAVMLHHGAQEGRLHHAEQASVQIAGLPRRAQAGLGPLSKEPSQGLFVNGVGSERGG